MLFHGPVFVLMVEETIVQVVDVVSVLDGCMATALTMLVLVMFDFLFAHGSNNIAPSATGQSSTGRPSWVPACDTQRAYRA